MRGMTNRKKKPGRRKLPADRRKTHELRASVTSADFDAADRKAAKFRMTLPELIRAAVKAY